MTKNENLIWKKDEARKLWREANELNLIFSSIVNKSRAKIRN